MDTSTLDLDKMKASAGNACRLMKVLSNPDRLMLLCQLSQGEFSVGELEEQLDIHQPTLSQQLGVLRSQGVVATRRELVEHQMLARHGIAQLVGRLFDLVDRPRRERVVGDTTPVEPGAGSRRCSGRGAGD